MRLPPVPLQQSSPTASSVSAALFLVGDPPGSRVLVVTPLEALFTSPVARLQVPARWPRLLIGESAGGLASGRPMAKRRRRAPACGEGGGVSGVGDGRWSTSASARGEDGGAARALVMLLTPEPKVNMEAPVGVDT